MACVSMIKVMYAGERAKSNMHCAQAAVLKGQMERKKKPQGRFCGERWNRGCTSYRERSSSTVHMPCDVRLASCVRAPR
eukprot:33567-Eustigmatos_ZCMA.PRE.1